MPKSLHVLLIDDDPNSNYVAKTILLNLGITSAIDIARNGIEGLDYLLKTDESAVFRCPDLIILDRKMPVMDAEEFIDALRNLDFVNRREIVILLISSTLSDEHIEKFTRLGVQEFAVKPLTPEKILDIQKKYFNQAESAEISNM